MYWNTPTPTELNDSDPGFLPQLESLIEGLQTCGYDEALMLGCSDSMDLI